MFAGPEKRDGLFNSTDTILYCYRCVSSSIIIIRHVHLSRVFSLRARARNSRLVVVYCIVVVRRDSVRVVRSKLERENKENKEIIRLQGRCRRSSARYITIVVVAFSINIVSSEIGPRRAAVWCSSAIPNTRCRYARIYM